jgi:hypothetical protein
VSCGGRVIKFWTLRQKRVKDSLYSNSNSSSQRQDGCRREYTLDGRCGVWPGGTQFNTCDLTCFTFAGCHDNMTNYQNGSRSNSSRVFCGSSTGSVFIWEQTEEKSVGINGKISLLLKEKLLSVVTDVHDGPVFDIDYHCNYHNDINNNDSNNNNDDDCKETEEDKDNGTEVLKENIITCGVDGAVNLWLIAQIQSTPLEHLASYSLSDSDSSSDCNDTAKSAVFSKDGMSAIAGTVEGSLLLLSFNSRQDEITARNILRR